MKKKLSLLLVAALLAACTPAVVTGCKSTPAVSVAYQTLADTQIVVDRAMRVYGDLCARGKVTVQDQYTVDTAHEHYRVSFRIAVAAASANYQSLTPDDVQTLANQVLKLIAQL